MTDQYVGGNAEYESQTLNDAWCSTSQGHELGTYPDFGDMSDNEAYWRVGYDRINYPSGSATKHLAEFGLKSDHRIKIDESGIWGRGASEEDWIDLLAPGGVSDHGELTGLEDDDHSQYHNATRANTWLGTKSLANLGTRNHSDLQNIGANDHIDNLTDITTRNHNDLLNINAGDNYEHITQTQKDALHTIYSHPINEGGHHDSHNDSRYLGITAKAADSQKLDNIDSLSFLRSDQADTATEIINFNTATATKPLRVSRDGNSTQVMELSVDDGQGIIQCKQDENQAGYYGGLIVRLGNQALQTPSFIISDYRAGGDTTRFRVYMANGNVDIFGIVDMNQHQISDLPAPSATNDAARKVYVDGKVSDVAYAGTWDGVTTIAPSKNAVYDKIETLGGGLIMATGTYTGNGALNRQITGLGITPKSLFIIAHNNDNPDGSWLGHKTDDMALWKILRVHTPQILDNAVKIIADGFEVYNEGGVNWWNGNGLNYYYSAWG